MWLQGPLELRECGGGYRTASAGAHSHGAYKFSRPTSEQSDLSDDEFSVLEVQLKQSGELSKGSPSSAGSHTPNMSNNVRGRLKQHIAFWERIEAPSFILDTIREGYKIPFKFEPPRSFKPNNHSAKSHAWQVCE